MDCTYFENARRFKTAEGAQAYRNFHPELGDHVVKVRYGARWYSATTGEKLPHLATAADGRDFNSAKEVRVFYGESWKQLRAKRDHGIYMRVVRFMKVVR